MKIFAHRGFSYKYPEATRAAYEGAIAIKVDGLECDIRLTRDRIPVCFHDRNLKRIAGISKTVSKISLSELRQLTDVMTLRELIDLANENQKEINYPGMKWKDTSEYLRVIKLWKESNKI